MVEVRQWLLIAALAFMAGAAGSTAIGIWWTAGELSSIRVTNTILAARFLAMVVRFDALDAQVGQETKDLNGVRDRVTAIETRLPDYIPKLSEVLEQTKHLSSLDGRADALARQIADEISRSTQVDQRLCVALAGISAASAKRAGCQ